MGLRKLREEKGLTQRQLADKLGVCRECIYYWEVQGRKPRMKQLLKLAEVLGCDVATVINAFLSE